jgi:hypothetical protein
MKLTLDLQGIPELNRARLLLSSQQFDKATKSALAFAAAAVPPAVAKGIGQSYAIKAARIKQDISRVSITPDGETASIRFSTRPPTLAQFNPRPGTRGTGRRGKGRGRGWTAPARPGRPVTAIVLRSKGRQPYRGAFMATGASGNSLVLKRTPSGLKALYAPSIGRIFAGRSQAGEQLRADAIARVRERFAKGLERSIGRTLRGYG